MTWGVDYRCDATLSLLKKFRDFQVIFAYTLQWIN